MSDGSKKLYDAQQSYESIEEKSGAGPAVSPGKDDELHEKWHNRAYNPIDDAERGSVSEKLNGDAGRYRRGPGPM